MLLSLLALAAPPASTEPPAAEAEATPRWPGELELELDAAQSIDEAGSCFRGEADAVQRLHVWVPTEQAADLELLSALACGEDGLGYACGPAVDIHGEVEELPEDELRLQRGAKWAGHMAMPIGWRHTEVRLKHSSRGVALTITVLGHGSPLGDEGLAYLCDEARTLVAGAVSAP